MVENRDTPEGQFSLFKVSEKEGKRECGSDDWWVIHVHSDGHPLDNAALAVNSFLAVTFSKTKKIKMLHHFQFLPF